MKNLLYPDKIEDPLKHLDIMFKGRDGRDYATSQELSQADDSWKNEHIQYKSRDGQFHLTTESLDTANEAWKKQNLFYIVHDAELGRREIAPGTGDVQVCVGHFIERDELGQPKYVPKYRTERF